MLVGDLSQQGLPIFYVNKNKASVPVEAVVINLNFCSIKCNYGLMKLEFDDKDIRYVLSSVFPLLYDE